MKANFHSGSWGKVKTFGGALLVADGVRRIFQGVTGGDKDPSKPEAEGSQLVTVATGAGEALVGALTMRAGGRNLALGA